MKRRKEKHDDKTEKTKNLPVVLVLLCRKSILFMELEKSTNYYVQHRPEEIT